MSQPSASSLMRSPATRIFLRAVKITANPFTETAEFIQACNDANQRFRQGQDLVRFQLEAERGPWTDEVMDATLNLAGFLGMCRGETPLTGKYNLIISTGAARRAPYNRLCAVVQTIIDGRAEADFIVTAGSTRPLLDAEKKVAEDYAPGAKTEYDLCFGAREVVLSRFPELEIEAVCSENPHSGNDEVIDQVMRSFQRKLPDHPSVAVMTTQIYVKGLHYDLARAAKRHGWSSFLSVGHCSDPEMVFKRTIATYHSECLSTLRKAALALAEGC